MGNIYPIDAERQMIIYESNNHICLRTVNSLTIGRPAILCSDYLSNLSTTILNNMLYYSYINLENDIVIKNVIDTSILYTLECKDSLTVHTPFISEYNNRLILTYAVKNPLNSSYSVKIIYPFENEAVTEINYTYDEAPNIYHFVLYQSLILVTSTSTTNNIVNVNTDGSFKELFDEEIISKKISSYYDEEIKNKDIIISNIKEQYSELMNIAIQYKNEAKKWYDKYTEK